MAIGKKVFILQYIVICNKTGMYYHVYDHNDYMWWQADMWYVIKMMCIIIYDHIRLYVVAIGEEVFML